MGPFKPRIEIHTDNVYGDQVNTELLIRSVEMTLSHQRLEGPVELTVVITGDGHMRRLNRAYRGVDAPTDVLAFVDEGDSPISAPGAGHYLGDVVISYDQAGVQAQQAGHPIEAELQLLVVHGVLHLLGHDHVNPDQQIAMWAAQAKILGDLGVLVSNFTPED